jgi:glutamyl-tRNA reductase
VTHGVNRFFVVGLSFKKTDLTQRNLFAFNSQQCADIYKQTDSDCLKEFFILSTCNRTEIYGFAPCEYLLTGLLQQHAKGNTEAMQESLYIKEGSKAAEHFFEVASGLDSQIPGDYEIISQIKSSFQLAKHHNRTNGYLEKLFNFSLQASKEVKNTTSFSDGTLSVSYAVVQQLIQQPSLSEVTIVGAGETGELTIKYIRKFLPEIKINLVNRDQEKLNLIADRYQTTAYSLNDLSTALETSDALIVATNAQQPVVYLHHLEHSTVNVIYDLSVPQNVAKEVYESGRVDILDVDTISEKIKYTVSARLAEVPKVEAIITRFTQQFTEWSFRHHYFSVAGHVQGGAGKTVSRKALHTIFQQWQETALVDSSLAPYSERTQQSMLLVLQHNFPDLLPSPSAEKKEIKTHACTTTGHAKQSSCFMANQCCRIATHPAW